MKKVKKIIGLVLAFGIIFLVSCGKDDSQRFLDEQEQKMNEAMVQVENSGKDTAEDVFVLRNNTGKNIYGIEFAAAGKESLVVPWHGDKVLADGYEIKIQSSGEWEIKAKFMDEDGGYYYESFGKCELKSVVVLKTEGDKYLAVTVE